MNRPKLILIRNAQAFDFGGGERFPVSVSKIISNVYEPIIITRSPKLLEYAANSHIRTIKGLWWSNQNWSGSRVLLLPLYVSWQLILFLWYIYMFISIKPKAVHIQSKDDFIAGTLAARLIGARVIWTDHADLKHIWHNLRIWYKNPVGKWVYLAAHHADIITVISQSEYKEVTSHLPKHSSVKKHLTIINNGTVDVRNQYPSRPGGLFTFCSTNRLVTDKGIREMIESFQQFTKKYPNSQLILVGNGPEEGYFQHLASDNRRIKFVGYQADPLSFVASADILLQPTYHEGFSISALEGMMMEKPIIATNIGGIPEMIDDGETGILIPIKDSAALYNAMEKLYLDKALRDSLGQAARARYLANFQFDQIVKERFLPLYEGHDNTRD